MKKLFVGAAIVVAGLASAKGTVENKLDNKEKKEVKKEDKSPKQTCGVQITYYSGGRVVGTQLVTSDQPDLKSCQAWQNTVRFLLQISGYWTI